MSNEIISATIEERHGSFARERVNRDKLCRLQQILLALSFGACASMTTSIDDERGMRLIVPY